MAPDLGGSLVALSALYPPRIRHRSSIAMIPLFADAVKSSVVNLPTRSMADLFAASPQAAITLAGVLRSCRDDMGVGQSSWPQDDHR